MSVFFYIAGWARGQYEVNPVFWLATQANKMGISCSPRTLSQATKKCVGQTHKVRYFWKILLMKLQKAAEGSQVLQTHLAFIPSSWNKQAILDCYYSKIFCYIINPSLTNLFLHFCGPPPWSQSIKKAKKNSANIHPYWLHAWSITHMFLQRLTRFYEILFLPNFFTEQKGCKKNNYIFSLWYIPFGSEQNVAGSVWISWRRAFEIKWQQWAEKKEIWHVQHNDFAHRG